MCLQFFPTIAIRLVDRDVAQELAVWEGEAHMDDVAREALPGWWMVIRWGCAKLLLTATRTPACARLPPRMRRPCWGPASVRAHLRRELLR